MANVRCDQCGLLLSIPHADRSAMQLPAPWREVAVEGFVGVFYACSETCDEGVRARQDQTEPTLNIKKPSSKPPKTNGKH